MGNSNLMLVFDENHVTGTIKMIAVSPIFVGEEEF